MKNLILFLGFLCFHVFAQKQANIWYFGNGAGLDFNDSCGPKVLTDGQIDGFEGCTTISDEKSGQLLFYTNSEKIWNRNHQVMPNSTLVPNGKTLTQVLIVKRPGFDSVYYVVTSQIQGYYGRGLLVHEVDMSLNSSLGGLTYKDSLVCPGPIIEGLTAIKHANGRDIWVITHGLSNNRFMAFLITTGGVSRSPVVSEVGRIHGSYSDANGETKASPRGNKLAVVSLTTPNIELFDFNKNTGEVSNAITLSDPYKGQNSALYGVAFSPGGRFLYVARSNIPGSAPMLMQYDISSGSQAAINSSRANFMVPHGLYSLKLAPDKKIYVGRNYSSFIDVINYPDSAGAACNYVIDGVFLGGRISSWGLNNLMEYNCYCDGCRDADCESNSGFSLPNAFSPNGDGKNDVFCLQGWDQCVTRFRVMIFDRWGERVFESGDPAFCWDGVYKGKKLEADVFVMVIRAETEEKTITKKGNITLIR